MMNLQPTSHRSGGFTLIELLCVVSVAGFLCLVAYPTFQSAIHKSRRSDALVAMMQVQLAQERHRSSRAAYGSLDEIGIAAQSPSRHYTLVVSASSESGYEVEATANGGQSADTSCRVLKLKVDGGNLSQTSGPTGSTGNPTEVNKKCWSL